MTAKFGVDFGPLPRLITVRKVSAAHEGSVHTDSASKVATLLLYLHHGWASPEGRIRVLRRGGSLDDPVAEISPEEGNVFAFLRSDRSWHGHTPFTGERRVVQVAWPRDAAELERKRKRHRRSPPERARRPRGRRGRSAWSGHSLPAATSSAAASRSN